MAPLLFRFSHLNCSDPSLMIISGACLNSKKVRLDSLEIIIYRNAKWNYFIDIPFILCYKLVWSAFIQNKKYPISKLSNLTFLDLRHASGLYRPSMGPKLTSVATYCKIWLYLVSQVFCRGSYGASFLKNLHSKRTTISKIVFCYQIPYYSGNLLQFYKPF